MNKDNDEDVYYHVQNYDTVPSQQGSSFATIPTLSFKKVIFHDVHFYCNDSYTLVGFNGQLFRITQGGQEFRCNHNKGTYCGDLMLPIPNNSLSIEIIEGQKPVFRLGNHIITTEMLKDNKPLNDSKDTAKNTMDFNAPVEEANVTQKSEANKVSQDSLPADKKQAEQANHMINTFDYKDIIDENETERYKECSKDMERFVREQDLRQERRDIEAIRNLSIDQQATCTSQQEFFQLIEVSISSIVFSAAAKIGVDFIDCYNLQNPNLKTIFSTAIGWTVAYLNVPIELYKQHRNRVHFGITFGAAVFALFDNYTGGSWTYDGILKYFIRNMESYQEIFRVSKESFDKGNEITTSYVRKLLISTLKEGSTAKPVSSVHVKDLTINPEGKSKVTQATTTKFNTEENKIQENTTGTSKEDGIFQLGGHTCESRQKVNLKKPGEKSAKVQEANKAAQGPLDKQKEFDADATEKQFRLYAQNKARTIVDDFNKKQEEKKRM